MWDASAFTYNPDFVSFHFLPDMPLSIEDLAWLMYRLRSITTKWKELLLALTHSNEEIIAIIEGFITPYTRMNEGITRWLQQTSLKPTLKALATALRSKSVKEAGVASDIMKGKQCVRLYSHVVILLWYYIYSTGVHACSEGYCNCPVYICMCTSSVHSFLPPRGFTVTTGKTFRTFFAKMLSSEAMASFACLECHQLHLSPRIQIRTNEIRTTWAWHCCLRFN